MDEGNRPTTEFCRMTSEQLQRRTKKELAEMARKKGVPGWHAMRKEELVAVLAGQAPRPRAKAKKPARVAARPAARAPRARPQLAAARNTSGAGTGDLSVG